MGRKTMCGREGGKRRELCEGKEGEWETRYGGIWITYIVIRRDWYERKGKIIETFRLQTDAQ